MAASQPERRPRWWPSFSEWFDEFPFDLRPSDGEHMIRVEEHQDDGTYTVKAELPGVDPDKDVQVTLQDGILTIHAERTQEKKDKQRSEFRYGSFTRSVTLPTGVSEDDITATYDKGVLTVTAPTPKAAGAEPRKIAVTGGT